MLHTHIVYTIIIIIYHYKGGPFANANASEVYEKKCSYLEVAQAKLSSTAAN